MGLTDGEDSLAIRARQRKLKVQRASGQLDWFIVSFQPWEMPGFREGPEIESAFDPILENEKPSVRSPGAAACYKHLVESRSVRGGLHDCHRIDEIIKLRESENPSVRGKSKSKGNAVSREEFSGGGTISAHQVDVMSITVDDACSIG